MIHHNYYCCHMQPDSERLHAKTGVRILLTMSLSTGQTTNPVWSFLHLFPSPSPRPTLSFDVGRQCCGWLPAIDLCTHSLARPSGSVVSAPVILT